VFLDVSKAFDTIPHEVIPDALRRKGLPEPLVRLVRNSYSHMHTIIKRGTNEIPISLKRGVKQGDPLSFIFNSIIEPLLINLEKEPGYQITSPCKISSLAFADDLLLTANDTQQVTKLLNITGTCLTYLGMQLSSAKCTAFQIISTKSSWYMTEPQLTLHNGENISPAHAAKRITYLGAGIRDWTTTISKKNSVQH
jgi:hypothetical protein